MDYSLIATASTALGAARDLAKAAVGVRDFTQMATTVSQISDQLLKAQDSLFAHNAQLHALQQENFSLTNRLRELEEKDAERRRYALVEISDRTFVLGLKDREQLAAENLLEGWFAEPHHHICQPCMAKGIKSVLQKHSVWGSVSLDCSVCKEKFSTGEIERA